MAPARKRVFAIARASRTAEFDTFRIGEYGLYNHIALLDSLLDLHRQRRGVCFEAAVERMSTKITSIKSLCAVRTGACTILVDDGGREAPTIITVQKNPPLYW
jgi:hypothetical protein